MRSIKSLIVVIILLVILLTMNFTRCAPYYNVPFKNTPLDSAVTVKVKENTTKIEDKNTLIFVALSGGGTRAAAVSWATLGYIKKIPYATSNLANEIDYISGISGGSFAAAGWCLFSDSMDVFKKHFVQKNIQWDIAKNLFIPWVGLRVFFSRFFDRIDIAAEYYDKNVFEKKTFGDLPAHPTLWINSTHLALGKRFTYTHEYFNLLSSDLNKYPIGYACAASSAFPVLLTPMTLVNYGQSKPDSILQKNLSYRMAKRNSRRDIEKDFYCKTIEFYNDKRNKWMHYADGGLVDNQGLQVILDQFKTNGIINKKLNSHTLQRLIIINVNAGTVKDDKSCRKEKAPGTIGVVNYTMTTSMDMLSAKRWMEIKKITTDLWQNSQDTYHQSIKEKPYCIEVNFRNIKDKKLRDECNKLPTSFYLNKKQLELIDSVIPKLINSDPAMIRLRKVLKEK